MFVMTGNTVMETDMDWSAPAPDLEDGELDTDSDRDTGRINHNYTFDNSKNNITEHSFFTEDDLELMGKRAQRFRFDGKDESNEDELQQLYKSLSISTDEDIRHTLFDTVHIYGTHKMTTSDIFEYFFTHKPLFLEWVDENSCNVVWKDNISAAKAMVFYSKPINYTNAMDCGDESTDAVNISSIPVTIPAGKWRAGARHPNSEYIFLRFGNKSDKKLSEDEKLNLYSKKYNEFTQTNVVGSKVSESLKSRIRNADEKEPKKNPWGDLSKSWGINDAQEMFFDKPFSANNPDADPNKKSVKERIGLTPMPVKNGRPKPTADYTKPNSLKLRLGKRSNSNDYEELDESADSSDEEWKTKIKKPRMRMHADDEEDKIAKLKKSKPVWKNNITIEIENDDINDREIDERLGHSHSRDTKSVHSRLGTKHDSSDSESDSERRADNKRPGLHSDKQVKSTVWSRLDISRRKPMIELESESDGSDELKSYSDKSKSTKDRDLRERIAKRSQLRIQIENDCFDTDSN